MKKKVLLFLMLFALYLSLVQICVYADDYHFRNTKWQMSVEEVMAAEGTYPIYDTNEPPLHAIGYKDNVMGKNVYITYSLLNNKLWKTMYILNEKYTNSNLYISDYKAFQRILIEEYGKPTSEDIIWKNDLYKDKPQQYGFAVSLGHVSYRTVWKNTNESNIFLTLKGDNYKINCTIAYYSIEMEEEVKKWKASEQKSKF